MAVTVNLTTLHEIRDNYLAALQRELPDDARDFIHGIAVGLGLAIAVTEGGEG